MACDVDYGEFPRKVRIVLKVIKKGCKLSFGTDFFFIVFEILFSSWIIMYLLIRTMDRLPQGHFFQLLIQAMGCLPQGPDNLFINSDHRLLA